VSRDCSRLGMWNDPRLRGDMVWNGPGSAQQHFVLQCARDT
jgi:hypothetical protein